MIPFQVINTSQLAQQDLYEFWEKWSIENNVQHRFRHFIKHNDFFYDEWLFLNSVKFNGIAKDNSGKVLFWHNGLYDLNPEIFLRKLSAADLLESLYNIDQWN